MANDKEKFMYYKRQPEIRISGVARITYNQIKNISENLGINMSDFLKPKLREIADSYPEHMKKPPVNY